MQFISSILAASFRACLASLGREGHNKGPREDHEGNRGWAPRRAQGKGPSKAQWNSPTKGPGEGPIDGAAEGPNTSPREGSF